MEQVQKICGRVTRGVALLLLLLAPYVVGDSVEAKMPTDRLWLITETGEHPIDIEIADSEGQKALGLMFRTSLADNAGMLFPYAGPPREVTMWMRNTMISLDMVFIRADGTVHRVEAATEPMSERLIESNGPVTAVLEVGAGVAAKLGVKPGTRVRHPVFNKASR